MDNSNVKNLIEYFCFDILSYSVPKLIVKNQLNVNQAAQWGTNVMNELIKKELENYFQID